MDFEKGAQGGALQLLDTRGNDLDVNASRFGLSTPNSKHGVGLAYFETSVFIVQRAVRPLTLPRFTHFQA